MASPTPMQRTFPRRHSADGTTPPTDLRSVLDTIKRRDDARLTRQQALEQLTKYMNRASRSRSVSHIQQALHRLASAHANTTRYETPPSATDNTPWHGAALLEPAPSIPNAPDPSLPPKTGDSTGKIDRCVFDPLRRLVDRTTFGFTYDELLQAYERGWDGYIDWQLDYENIDDSELQNRLDTEFFTLNESNAKHIWRAYAKDDYLATEELIMATILRQATSKRQLYERMVDFWTDHFNIYLFKDNDDVFKPNDDRDVIRQHALGNFHDLLLASAKSPAMLTYLDGVYNFAWAPNQNYARELLELHTLGVDNFTQHDMLEVARCFTGWSINWNFQDVHYGEFKFQHYWHDYQVKHVLGYTIPAGNGVQDGEKVIDILCNSPRGAALTSKFLAKKLAVRFWGENPPQGLLDEIAQAYLDTNGDIKSMVRAALSQRWLTCAPPRYKRPYHLALSALRQVPTYINDYGHFFYILDVMGNAPFLWVPPNGYPESINYWAGNILPRWRFGFYLLQEQNEIDVDTSPFTKPNADLVIEAIDNYLFGNIMPRSIRDMLFDFLGDGPIGANKAIDAVGLAIASPAYQLY